LRVAGDLIENMVTSVLDELRAKCGRAAQGEAGRRLSLAITNFEQGLLWYEAYKHPTDSVIDGSQPVATEF
jgi:hypothetical protein